MTYPDVQRRSRRGRMPYGGGTSTSTTIRRLIESDAVAQTYITIPAATAVGDFSFKFKIIAPTSAADFSVPLSGTATETRVSRINSDGTIRLYVGGSNITSSTAVRDGQSREVELTRVGQVVTLFVNGTQEAQTNNASNLGSFVVTEFFRRSTAASYFGGFMYDIDFVSGFTQVGNPAGNPLYPLDDDLTTTTIRNTRGVNGAGDGTAVGFDQQDSQDYTLVDSGATWQQVANEWTFGDYTTTGSETQNQVLLGSASGVIEQGAIYRTNGESEVISNRIRLLVGSETVRPNDWPDDSGVTGSTRLLLQYTSSTPPPSGQVTRNITAHRILRIAP